MPSKKLQKQQNKETDSLTNEQDQEGDELFQSSDIKIASKENENDQKDIPVTVLEIKIKEEPMEVVQSEALEDDEEISVISPIHTKKRLFILEDDEEDSEDDNVGYGELDNLFIESEETTIEEKMDNQYNKTQTQTPKEIIITHYTFNDSVIAVTLNGDTIPLKKYFSGEEVYETQHPPHEEYQCPLLYKYTSTEGGHIQTLHTQAMKHGRKKKITNYEDEFPGPWRTNGRAYINWVVGPKGVQEAKQRTSQEVIQWRNAVRENTTNLLKIAKDSTNLKIKSMERKVSVPQMVTWLLYAAAVHDDFAKFVRYPIYNLKTFEYFFTPIKTKNTISNAIPDTNSSAESSSSSSSSSTSSSSSSLF